MDPESDQRGRELEVGFLLVELSLLLLLQTPIKRDSPQPKRSKSGNSPDLLKQRPVSRRRLDLQLNLRARIPNLRPLDKQMQIKDSLVNNDNKIKQLVRSPRTMGRPHGMIVKIQGGEAQITSTCTTRPMCINRVGKARPAESGIPMIMVLDSQ